MDRIKKMINKNKNAFLFVLVILFFFLLGKIHDLAPSIFMISAIVVGLAYSLFTTYNYRKRKLKYVVFPSVNDSNSEFTFFFFGSALLLGAAFFYCMDYMTSIWLYVVGVVIVLLFFNGFYRMAQGFLNIKSGVLRAYGLEEEIKVDEINYIEIHHNRILLKAVNGKTWLASNIKIDKIASQEIENYLSKNLVKQPVTIVNQLGGITNRNSSI